MSRNTLKQKISDGLEAVRFRLARPDALLHLALFGLITGFLSGGAIVLFRLFVENIQDYLLPGNGAENYEELPPLLHFLFPLIASCILAFVFYKWAKGIRVLGVARVMERIAYHQGHLTLRGFFIQFVGAAVAIIGGHSVGREGPHAYLGATASSLFGQLFRLPNNSIRTLVASGAAAGIAASFNTPLAGVIFALEVIMMEYALNSFIPVMLAAVVATALSNAVLGGEPAFIIPELHTTSIVELPVILVLGVVTGACAAMFNHILTLIATRTQSIEIWWRIIISGVLVGILGYIQPVILGIGYDTVDATLMGEYALGTLITFMLLKLMATSISVGLGIPGGMIGPAFFIGATLGAAIGLMAIWLYGDNNGENISHVGFYALLGMGAMMGASLQAPLAALTAIMELTYNPGIIMPGMLVIVVAQLTASEIFKKQSLFVTMLRSNGLDFSIDPVLQVLRSVGVASVLDTSFKQLNSTISRAEALLIIDRKIRWLIINDSDGLPTSLMPVTELAKHLHRKALAEETQGALSDGDNDENNDRDNKDGDAKENEYEDKENKKESNKESNKEEQIDLLEIPAQRLHLTPISLQANLMQAHEAFVKGAEALVVVFRKEKIIAGSRIYGIITKQIIEEAYVPKTIKTLA